MKPGVFLLGLVLAASSGNGACAADPRILAEGFGGPATWHVVAQAPWWAAVDLRNMLNLFHPFAISETGAGGGAWREFTIPADWKPPFALRFYCADDYFADAQKHKPGQPGTESFFGHRFKQVLIDGAVIWERDVVDENTVGSPTLFDVDITRHVAAGKPFKLTFRVYDRVTTRVRHPQDVWFRTGTWYAAGDGKTEQPPRFHTAAWFADPVLGEASAVRAASLGRRPHEAVTAARHRARWPMAPRGWAASSPAGLRLVSPVAVPGPGFPLRCGIPIPPGVLKQPDRVQLRDGAQALPLQTATTGVWPDGSVQWLLVDAILPPGLPPGKALQLHLGVAPSSAAAGPLQVDGDAPRRIVRTGPLEIAIRPGSDRLLDAVTLAGKPRPALENLKLRMAIRLAGRVVPVTAATHQCDVVQRGPASVCLESSGSLQAGPRAIGRFVFRLQAYAGLPTIQTSLRILNDVKPEPYAGTIDDPALEIVDLALTAALPQTPRRQALAGICDESPVSSDSGMLRVHQAAPGAFAAGGGSVRRGKHAAGWIVGQAAGGAVHAAVWRFWQQYPKSLAVGNELEIGLFAPTPEVPLYRPRFGEAKRHDIQFTFSDGPQDAAVWEALGRLAQEPPRLFDGPWFCRSGSPAVLDPDWFGAHPELARWATAQYADLAGEHSPTRFGLRSFGDQPYNEKSWLNGYWARVQGPLHWGLSSGNAQWLERSFEIARHMADVDTVHIPPQHPDWKQFNGLTCALGYDHSVHGGLAAWPAFQLGESLLLHAWMTGDRDSREAGLANADYCMRNQAGLGSSEARSQARPMLNLLRAWQATGDPKYRRAAARYFDRNDQTQHVIDWRRGTYIQPTYENYRCVSAGLDSMYAQNIYKFYRLTGDVDAAQMVVAVADSVYAESMLPQEQGIGDFLFYVRYSRCSWYYPQMAVLFFMAYDLTDDLRFLRAGRAAMARYLVCKDPQGNPMYQPYGNFGWLDPEAGGWLRQFADIPTAPVRITGQSLIPDPARFLGD